MNKDDFCKSIINTKSIMEIDDIFCDIQKSKLSDIDKNELFGMIHVMKKTVIFIETIENHTSKLPDNNYIKKQFLNTINEFKRL
jgi:hypothetical protein